MKKIFFLFVLISLPNLAQAEKETSRSIGPTFEENGRWWQPYEFAAQCTIRASDRDSSDRKATPERAEREAKQCAEDRYSMFAACNLFDIPPGGFQKAMAGDVELSALHYDYRWKSNALTGNTIYRITWQGFCAY